MTIEKRIDIYVFICMKEFPLISVVTVSYNAIATIEQTILSVINQKYSAIEYIIIDVGITDGTVDIIKKYEDKISYWVSERDNGIYDAMNKGIRHATGKIVGIINSDDWYEMDAFATVADLYLKKGDLYLYHGDIRYCLGKQETRVDSPNLNLSDFYKGSCVFHPTVFVPLAVYRKVGVFDTAYKIAGDYDFLLRCYLNSIKFMYINRIIANMRITGISNRQRIMTYEEVKTIGLRYYRNKCKVHIAFFLNCFVYYLVCLKHCLYK